MCGINHPIEASFSAVPESVQWFQVHVSYGYFAKDLRDNKDFLFSICLTERKVLLSLNDFMFCFKISSGECDGCSKFCYLQCISKDEQCVDFTGKNSQCGIHKVLKAV